MEDKRPCAWDRLIVESTAARRCAFLSDQDDPAALSREVRARRAYWISRLPAAERLPSEELAKLLPVVSLFTTDPRLTDRPLVRANDPLFIRLLVPFAFVLVCYLILIAMNSVRWFWLLLLGILGAGLLMKVRWPNRAAERARIIQCPDCGYDLSGCPDGVAIERAGGVRFGPRTCPECGAAWPLIPPPVPVTLEAGPPR